MGSHSNAELIAQYYNQQLSRQFAEYILDNIIKIK